ncbi:MAG: hypothetical protein J4F98_05955 [Acidobacteria bacterium]|nr:hypothetical protein [Acidobacteriota bacterium]
MRLHSSRGIRSLICLVSVLVCVSAPLAAQRGIDLLNSDEVLRLNSPGAEPFEVTSTVWLVATSDRPGADPERVTGATSHTTTYQYDDGVFENYEVAPPVFPPFETEVAQQFDLDRSGRLVSVAVCFQRPMTDLLPEVVFDLRFYADADDEPGAPGGFTYTWTSRALRRAGDDRCLTFSGAMAGKRLARGKHWIAVRWQSNTNKILGEDSYALSDNPPRDNRGAIEFDTSVRKRIRNSAASPWPEMFFDPRGSAPRLKAYGIRLVVDESTPPAPEPDPDPEPEPEPEPDSSCTAGTCLLEDGRFRVRTRYSDGMMSEVAQTPTGLGGAAALFSFGSAGPSLLVRMVDDCDSSGYWMLYAGSASDMTYSIAVRDTTSDSLMWFPGIGGDSIRGAMAFACSN